MKEIATIFLVYLCIILTFHHKCFADAGKFYDGAHKYRGFYWFEKDKQKNNIKETFQNPSPEEAAKSMEARKKELDDARNQMLDLAFRNDVPEYVLREAVMKYKRLEVKMFDGAFRLVDAAEMANFVDPKLADRDSNPTNVYANKIKRKVDAEKDQEIIRSFANNYDLILFKSDECPYSQAFLPIITNFAETYSFNLEITNLDSRAGKLAQNIGVNVVPTVVAISRSGKELFEINRGMNSISDIERSILLADKYSKEQRGRKK